MQSAMDQSMMLVAEMQKVRKFIFTYLRELNYHLKFPFFFKKKKSFSLQVNLKNIKLE